MSVVPQRAMFGWRATALQDVEQLDYVLILSDYGETHSIEGGIGWKILANTARVADVAEMQVLGNWTETAPAPMQ